MTLHASLFAKLCCNGHIVIPCHSFGVHRLNGSGWEVQVNYVGKAANLYEDAGFQLTGSSYVVNKVLGTTWLWDRIRVVGGAYGGFSDFDTHSGDHKPPSSRVLSPSSGG